MYEFHPYFTNDGSVGLYNSEFNDIYHSATGALNEAYEKFIYPVDFDMLLNKDSIKVLDICYGIGYNSKSFLNYIFENKILKNFSQKNLKNKIMPTDSIASIDTNNNSSKNNNKFFRKIQMKKNSSKIYNEEIYTYNTLPKIYIKAVDNDKILSYLSPFIKTGEKNILNNKLNFNYKEINKFLNKDKNVPHKKVHNIINFLILERIIKNYPEIFENQECINILETKEYSCYFDSNIKAIFKSLHSDTTNSNLFSRLNGILHNIYYKYVSNRYKSILKSNNMQNIIFDLKNGDARQVIKEDNNLYNLIFLDAFTPSKCPCLWSLEFFQMLYEHLEDDGVILTYSTSAAVRNAMINAGLHVGKIFNERENKYRGTVASKNPDIIKSHLSESDLSLLKTKAGIFYRDKNLTALNEAIIETRNLEYQNSTLISSSQYYKKYKGK